MGKKNQLKEDYPFIKGKIDRFENGKFILKFEDGQFLQLPVELLREEHKVGDELIFFLVKESNIEQARESLAKDLLKIFLKKD